MSLSPSTGRYRVATANEQQKRIIKSSQVKSSSYIHKYKKATKNCEDKLCLLLLKYQTKAPVFWPRRMRLHQTFHKVTQIRTCQIGISLVALGVLGLEESTKFKEIILFGFMLPMRFATEGECFWWPGPSLQV